MTVSILRSMSIGSAITRLFTGCRIGWPAASRNVPMMSPTAPAARSDSTVTSRGRP